MARRRPFAAILDRPWALVVALLGAALVWWAMGTRSEPHHLQAAFTGAQAMTPGLDVQIDGLDVGKVSSVTREGDRAIVGLGIDDAHWPLPRGTRATLRWGTTIGNGTRKVDLEPGPADAPPLPEDGIIGEADTLAPVELDDVFRTLDARSRGQLRRMLGRTSTALLGTAPALNRGLRVAPAALGATGDVMHDLAADEAALRGLVVNGHRATRVLASRTTGIERLVDAAATTMRTFAVNSDDVRRSLAAFPSTLQQTRATLARLRTSAGRLDGLMTDLGPGAAELRPLAAAARPAVARLRSTAPALERTLTALRTQAPAITRLVQRGTPFAEETAPVLADLAPMVACLRPYAPEVAGFLSNWASWFQNYDGIAHYARIHGTGSPTMLDATPEIDSKTYASLPGVDYGLIRPPGLNAGKPWLQPACGITAATQDPANDPEDAARTPSATTRSRP